MLSSLRLLALCCCSLLLATCAPPPQASLRDAATSPPAAVVGSNASFDSNDLTGWTTTTYLNAAGMTQRPPANLAQLQLTPGGASVNKTTVLSAASCAAAVPPPLSPNATLRYPRYGIGTAQVNQNGNNRNVNAISQNRVVDAADMDPFDGRIHLRASVAGITQNGHPGTLGTAYVYAIATNLSQGGNVLGTFYNDAQAPSVPWMVDGSSANSYSNWQLVDFVPAPGAVRLGDNLSMTFLAAGCTGSGHAGSLLVDGTGSFLPGLSLIAVAPQQVGAGKSLTYTYRLSNYGSAPVTSPTATLVLPDLTTFSSFDAIGAQYCLPPAGNVVRCTFPSLDVANSTVFAVNLQVAANANGTLIHGTYSSQGDGAPALFGPAVSSAINPNVLADLSASLQSVYAAAPSGSSVEYVLRVVNKGPATATNLSIADQVPAQLSGLSWACYPDDGASCTSSGGSGGLSTSATLTAGLGITCIIDATVGSGSNSTYRVNVAPPSGVLDADLRNNAATFDVAIGNTNQLTIWKNLPGRVVSTPLGIDCDGTCDSATGSFLGGTVVTLTAMPAPGATFLGWTGNTCSGRTNPCVFTASGDAVIGANFSVDPSACQSDASCRARHADHYCDETFNTCNAKLPAGMALPLEATHGSCKFAASTACQTGWCNAQTSTCAAPAGTPCRSNSMCNANFCAADSRCGLADLLGPCSQDDGALLCRSHACGSSGACQVKLAAACRADADCPQTFYCDGTSRECVPSLPDGQPIPSDGLHTGKCTRDSVQVCQSVACNPNSGLCARALGVACDAALDCGADVCADDGRCGQLNNRACLQSPECRSAVCGGDGLCGQLDNNLCSASLQCRSGTCVEALCAVPGATTTGHGLLSGCQSGAFGELSIGLLPLLALLRLRRFRRGVPLILLLGALGGAPSAAQAAEAGFGVDRLWAAPAGSRWLGSDSLGQPRTGKTQLLDPNWIDSLAVRLDGNFAHDPLVVQLAGQPLVGQVVRNQAAVGLGVSLWPLPYLRVQARLPLQLFAAGAASADASHLNLPPESSFGLGDLRLGVSAATRPGALVDKRLGGTVSVSIPTGKAASYAGGSDLGIQALAQLAGEHDRLIYGAHVGGSYQKNRSFAGQSLGSRVLAGLAVGWQIRRADCLLGLEVPASLTVTTAERPFSVLDALAVEPGLGAHWQVIPQCTLHGVASVGLTRAIGQPQWRVAVAVDVLPLFDPADPARPPKQAPAAVPAPPAAKAPVVVAPPRPATPQKAPPPPFVSQAQPSRPMRPLINGRLLFASNRAVLLPADKKVLDQVAAEMRRHPDITTLVIEGHTDHFGSVAYNQQLAQRRVDATLAHLRRRGVAAARLEGHAYGKRYPAVPITQKGAADKNRRVVFLVPLQQPSGPTLPPQDPAQPTPPADGAPASEAAPPSSGPSLPPNW